MREDIRLRFNCEIVSKKNKKKKKKDKGKQKKRIIYLSDHIYLSVKQQVSEDNILILPAYKKLPEEKTDTVFTTIFVR